MYHSTDPRAALAAAPVGAKPAATHFAGAEYAKFYETPPAENQNGARTWYARGQNFIIAYSDADKGAVLSRTDQPDEYVVLLPDPGAGAEIVWGNERKVVDGHSISFVPAGASSVTLLGAAKVVRMVTTRSEDLAKSVLQRRVLRDAASQFAAVRAVAGGGGWREDPHLQSRRRGNAGPVRPDLPLLDLHGEFPRAEKRPARSEQDVAAPP